MINIQPILENEDLILYPLDNKDFNVLYETASDPEIWEQHPKKDRWKKEVFTLFFNDAMKSEGAFKIVDKTTGKTIGSTRIYDYKEQDNSIFIGYTFYAVKFWGTGINRSVKNLMLDYVFQFVEKVYFYIWAENLRSQISISRIGAIKIAEHLVKYQGEEKRLNYLYVIERKMGNLTKQ